MNQSQNKAVHKKISFRTYRLGLAAIGILINVLLAFFMNRMGLPLYLDTIGTIGVAAISGLLYPSILTAVFSSFLCSFFNESSIYMAFFNAIIAIYTVWFVRKFSFKNIARIFLFGLSVAIFTSLIVSTLQYSYFSNNPNSLVIQNAKTFVSASALPYFPSLLLINTLVYLFDKELSAIFVMLIKNILPKEFVKSFDLGIWKQRPLTSSEKAFINSWREDLPHSLRTRNTITIVTTAFLMILVMGWIGVRLYFDNAKHAKTQAAYDAVETASKYIDADKIDDFIKFGRNAPGYIETEKILYDIWKVSAEIQYLYAVRIEPEGCRAVFDVDTGDDEETYAPGVLIPFDKEFQEFLPVLFEGKEIEPVESRTIFGWMRSIYYPVRDSSGNTVCYVGADISLDYMADYMGAFMTKVALILSGFFILIIAYALWTTGVTTSFPISTIAAYVDRFAGEGEDREKLDENVRVIRSLDIHTNDEVQKLYEAICRMTLNQAEHIRDISRLSESTAKMQDGLIITMADMVESRDSDTGAHVQKTSAYVKIIVEGLKKKGYYAQKITPKFMSDVVRSAPLHDVGKINIPDGVLNKPGKLTDEEFAIMKTHTTAGKKILENAISTVQGENYLKEARNMAAYHHERWDGKGYPEGLHGEVIPLSARIMAVADVFDALASPRVYKPAFPLEKALAILQEGAGTQFDPKCVEVFMDSLSEVKMILKKYNPTVQ